VLLGAQHHTDFYAVVAGVIPIFYILLAFQARAFNTLADLIRTPESSRGSLLFAYTGAVIYALTPLVVEAVSVFALMTDYDDRDMRHIVFGGLILTLGFVAMSALDVLFSKDQEAIVGDS
jgi:hypothetical protein